MKKNVMMRMASVMLVLVLMTSSVISGTFAKYVTTNSGADFAQVAKFGVVITVADDMNLFNTEYETHDTNYDGSVSVQANTALSNAANGVNKDNRVAPGTDGFMTFNIEGTPEVATRLTVDVTASNNVIKLVAGDYELPAGEFANAITTVNTTADYEPIKFYFGEGVTEVPADAEYNMTMAQLVNSLDTMDAEFAPNTTLDKDYVIAWKWDFENEFTAGSFTSGEPYDDAKIVNFLDTYLGNQTTLQTEDLNFKITVEQID